MRFGQAFRNRPKLFALLKTMDSSSSWSSIARLQMRTFIDLLEQDPADMAVDQEGCLISDSRSSKR